MPTPNALPADPSSMLTSTTSGVQTAGADVLMSSLFTGLSACRRVYCCTTGNLALKRANDSSFVVYPVFSGQYVDGYIQSVGGTSSGTATGMQWIAEV